MIDMNFRVYTTESGQGAILFPPKGFRFVTEKEEKELENIYYYSGSLNMKLMRIVDIDDIDSDVLDERTENEGM